MEFDEGMDRMKRNERTYGMKTRILSAAAAIVLLVGVLVASMQWTWCISLLFAFLGAIAAYEMARTIGFSKFPIISVAGCLLSIILPISTEIETMFPIAETAFLCYAVFLFVYKLYRYEETDVSDLLLCGGMTVYIGYGFTSIVRLWQRYECGTMAMFLLVLSMAMAWYADTGAYFAGVFWGKHKLCPKISPKKTVEGLVGGIVSCILLTGSSVWIYVEWIHPGASISWGGVVCISVVCALISVVGDLIFSVIKRRYGKKDYGNIMPGHGGVLDRFDSVLLVAPVFGLFLQYLPIVHA